MSEYKLVLGLEIHMHLKTAKKMFCGCDANIYEDAPNTHTCPVCLGLPGALPIPNEEAVRKTQLFGMALGCELNKNSKFDRKHYFYPDLPKGYQISQYKEPLCVGTDGILERIHLEEDTAKSFHEGDLTLIDFNKSGMPLIEIVTKPVFTSASEAANYARNLRDLAKFMGISDADMEKGQMRIEPNISVRTTELEEKGELPDYKVEVKNINSFRFMEKAVEYELRRQIEALEAGETLLQENRGYDEKNDRTVAQRSKEDAHDYRYFPDPDIPPMVFDEEYFDSIANDMPELPEQIKTRLVDEYGLSENVAQELTQGPGLELLPEFEEKAAHLDSAKVANLLINKTEFRGLSVEDFQKKLAEMEDKIDDTDALQGHIEEILRENPELVAEYRGGKDTLLQYFVGQLMRRTKGKADAATSIQLLKKSLDE